MIKSETWHKASIVLLVGVLGILGYIMVQMFYPYKTIDIKEPMKVLNTPVKRGEVVRFELDYCKYTEADAEVSYVLYNDVSITYPPRISHAPIGCHVASSSAVLIPEYAPLGEYYVKFNIEYTINHYRTIIKSFDTEIFEVIK